MLERWRKHRQLEGKPNAKPALRPVELKTHEPKRVWKHQAYTCSQCKTSCPPSYFDYKKVKVLEDEDQVYLAVCLPCERTDIIVGPPVECVGCGVKKNRKEFSYARQRTKDYSTWRCLQCDFPLCQVCKAKPMIPKRAPYICEPCLCPPCKCGAQRPHKDKYRSTHKHMKIWECMKCRQSLA